MSRAADYGQPRLRVRRVSTSGLWIFARSQYEVEYTEPGAAQPSWTRETSSPVSVLRPYLGLADAHAVVASADRGGTSNGWSSLFDDDAG